MSPGPWIFLAFMAVMLWLLLIRPQRQRQAAHRQLLAELEPGADVLTVGGILGRVTSIAEDEVVLEIAPGTQVRVAKQAVTGVIPKDGESTSELQERG